MTLSDPRMPIRAVIGSFTTVEFNPPTPFGKITPISGATNQPQSLVLDWEDSTNVNIYEYCYDNNPDDSCNSDWVFDHRYQRR